MSDVTLVTYLTAVVNAGMKPGDDNLGYALEYIAEYQSGALSYSQTAKKLIAVGGPTLFLNTHVLAPDSMKDDPNLPVADKLRFFQKTLESNTANEKAIVDAKIVALESRNHQLETELAELKAMFHNFIIVDNAKTQALATAINNLHDNQQHITTAGETGELLNDNYNQL